MDAFHRKPWQVDWFDPELEHRKYTKAMMEDGDYSERVNLYFGDLHKHSELSPCARVNPYNGSPAECYAYARDEAETDFLAICDHAEHMSDEQWRECMDIAEAHNAPGRFIAWPAVVGATGVYGTATSTTRPTTRRLLAGTRCPRRRSCGRTSGSAASKR